MEQVSIEREFAEAVESGKPMVLATVVQKTGSGPSAVGRKMLVYPDGTARGTVGGGTLELLAIRHALEALAEGKPVLRKYDLTESGDVAPEGTVSTGMLCGGNVWIFYEPVVAPTTLYIFGAGHIGKALARILRDTGIAITVIDTRKNLLDEIPGVQKVHLNNIKEAEKFTFRPDSFFVIATNSHQQDYHILKTLYARQIPARYIAVVASKRKIGTFINQLKEELGEQPDLDILYSPAGLDIGGDSPAEIALSIAAEIIAVKYGKPANHLRNKRQETSGDKRKI